MDQIELDHVSQVIGYHPSYLEHFLKIQTFIMQGDGPLPYDYRHYLAIMVSSLSIHHICIIDIIWLRVCVLFSGCSIETIDCIESICQCMFLAGGLSFGDRLLRTSVNVDVTAKQTA